MASCLSSRASDLLLSKLEVGLLLAVLVTAIALVGGRQLLGVVMVVLYFSSLISVLLLLEEQVVV